jgi:large subunit ribosomal protein L18
VSWVLTVYVLVVHLVIFMRKLLLQAVLASASTLDKDLRAGATGNIEAATAVGKLIAERAKAAGVTGVAFDRSGFKYHGRVKALADAARAGGLEF